MLLIRGSEVVIGWNASVKTSRLAKPTPSNKLVKGTGGGGRPMLTLVRRKFIQEFTRKPKGSIKLGKPRGRREDNIVRYLGVNISHFWHQFQLLNGFIGHSFIPLGTKSNSSVIVNLHTLQITIVPAKLFPACCVFISRSLAMASISENSSVSRAQDILSTTTQLQRHLFSASLQSSTELVCSSSVLCNHFTRTTTKISFFYCCMRVRCYANMVLSVPLPSNGRLFWLNFLAFSGYAILLTFMLHK
jgi:hypothetical protein